MFWLLAIFIIFSGRTESLQAQDCVKSEVYIDSGSELQVVMAPKGQPLPEYKPSNVQIFWSFAKPIIALVAVAAALGYGAFKFNDLLVRNKKLEKKLREHQEIIKTLTEEDFKSYATPLVSRKPQKHHKSIQDLSNTFLKKYDNDESRIEDVSVVKNFYEKIIQNDTNIGEDLCQQAFAIVRKEFSEEPAAEIDPLNVSRKLFQDE